MSKNKELLRKTNQNQIRLTVLEKQVLRYTEFLSSIRGSRKESKIKLNPDFIEALEKEKEEFQSKINKEKPLFISNKIEKLKDFNSKIKNKVTDFQNSKVIKDELFKNLEQEIAQFEAMIEQLKQENRLLRQELELIIEKEQKSIVKTKLEKENSTLKEKIENIKNKDKVPFDEKTKEKKPLKVNKITYSNSQEKEI